MNTQQFYLTKLAEECTEVAQMALKTQQFGMDEVRRDQSLTNRQRLHAELNDLFAILEVLNSDHDLRWAVDWEALEAKKEKVQRYLNYSRALGLVEQEQQR